MRLTYPAIFYPDSERPGAYAVVVPDLPGCVSGGDTLADAIFMATDAASGWVLDELEDGKPLPEASPVASIVPEEPDGFASVLALDMDTYAERYGKKAVRKNLTIPAWLNTFAETNSINFSRVLQEALTGIYLADTRAQSTAPSPSDHDRLVATLEGPLSDEVRALADRKLEQMAS